MKKVLKYADLTEEDRRILKVLFDNQEPSVVVQEPPRKKIAAS